MACRRALFKFRAFGQSQNKSPTTDRRRTVGDRKVSALDGPQGHTGRIQHFSC